MEKADFAGCWTKGPDVILAVHSEDYITRFILTPDQAKDLATWLSRQAIAAENFQPPVTVLPTPGEEDAIADLAMARKRYDDLVMARKRYDERVRT